MTMNPDVHCANFGGNYSSLLSKLRILGYFIWAEKIQLIIPTKYQCQYMVKIDIISEKYPKVITYFDVHKKS